jgi:hypothetical protein
MSKPTQRQKQQRMFELVSYREKLREEMNSIRRHIAEADRQIRRLVK